MSVAWWRLMLRGWLKAWGTTLRCTPRSGGPLWTSGTLEGGLHPLERPSACLCRQPWWSCYRQDLWEGQVLIVFCLSPFIVLSGGTLSQWPTSRTQWWRRSWGRKSRPSHSSHDLFKFKYVCGGDLRCFVAGQICRKFTHFPSVKFPGLKMCACKKNDKYQVCLLAPTHGWVLISLTCLGP